MNERANTFITLHVYYNRQEALNALNDLMAFFPKAEHRLNPLEVVLGGHVCRFVTVGDVEEMKFRGLQIVAFILHDRAKQILDSYYVAYLKTLVRE